MSDELDKELQAINQIIKALEALEVDEKKRVIEYTLTRLGLKTSQSDGLVLRRRESNSLPLAPEVEQQNIVSSSRGAVVDIRTLTQEKGPKTAIEMAALVAFYLSELAPDGEKKSVIQADDVTKYFKQAPFKLPSGANGGTITLRNTKNAGYLEPTGEVGTYKLTPVGYNLVAYNMPRAHSKVGSVSRKKVTKKVTKKAATKKKA